MRPIFAAAALALICACASGYTEGPTGTTDGSIPIGTVHSDGGDAGADAGDAGADGGFDGGCVATSRSGLAVIDGCTGGQPLAGLASLSVSGQSCAVSITTNTVTTQCNGVADGGSNAFTGTCNAFPDCSSSSLPGTIFCNGGMCTLVICDGGTCP